MLEEFTNAYRRMYMERPSGRLDHILAGVFATDEMCMRLESSVYDPVLFIAQNPIACAMAFHTSLDECGDELGGFANLSNDQWHVVSSSLKRMAYAIRERNEGSTAFSHPLNQDTFDAISDCYLGKHPDKEPPTWQDMEEAARTVCELVHSEEENQIIVLSQLRQVAGRIGFTC